MQLHIPLPDKDDIDILIRLICFLGCMAFFVYMCVSMQAQAEEQTKKDTAIWDFVIESDKVKVVSDGPIHIKNSEGSAFCTAKDRYTGQEVKFLGQFTVSKVPEGSLDPIYQNSVTPNN